MNVSRASTSFGQRYILYFCHVLISSNQCEQTESFYDIIEQSPFLTEK